MIVTVGATKGGVGKSTLAVQLALSRTLAGQSILLVDGDGQRTAIEAITKRADADRAPGVSCVHYPEGRTLRAQVTLQAARYDHVIIDAGGRDTAALRAALLLSDLLLVPVQPRSVDVWALANMVDLIGEAQGAREERGTAPLQAVVALNLADPGDNADNRDAAAAVGEYPTLILLKATVRRRKAFANAVGLGLAVSEILPRDPKACDELSRLDRTVFNPTPSRQPQHEGITA